MTKILEPQTGIKSESIAPAAHTMARLDSLAAQLPDDLQAAYWRNLVAHLLDNPPRQEEPR